MAEIIKFTKERLRELQEEYNYLVNVRREEIKKDLEYARSLGDLSENADYDAARNNLSEIEKKIQEIRYKLDNHEIINENVKSDNVNLNSKVVFVNEKTKQTRTVTILGDEDADPERNIISSESPLGKALMGKKVGDKATVDCVNKFDLTILEIK